MNLKEIKEMIKLMNDNELVELELEREGFRIKLKKSAPGDVEHFPFASVEHRAVTPPATERPAKESPQINAELSGDHKVIASPMVGTFYRSPSPESPPFVEVGQIVEIGQVVCIVEAMKLMNEIKSEIRGKIVQATIENSEPVEFGQTLFVLEPV